MNATATVTRGKDQQELGMSVYFLITVFESVQAP